MSSLPSGIRLVALLNEHLNEIMERERMNHTSIHLYCTGPYWVAFERSAYQLHRAFPDSETTPLRLFAYPFPIVMVPLRIARCVPTPVNISCGGTRRITWY